MKHVSIAALAALLLALALPVLAGEEKTGTTESSFTGTWIKNEKLSDDPTKIMGGRNSLPAGKSGGMNRGGMRRGGMSGAGRGGMGGAAPEDMRPGNKRPAMMLGLERLEIFHEDEEFAVINARDIMQTVYTDGRRTERWTRMGQLFETARTTGDGIVVHSKGKDGYDRSVVYTLDEGGDRLLAVHTFTPPRQSEKITLKFVYDRVE